MRGIGGMQERTGVVDGVPMRWSDSGGDGPPVVLLHGIPTSPLLWRHVVPQLEGVRALAWELVGYGGSWRAGAGRDISVSAQAGYLRSWLRRERIEEAVLVGHDLGGGIAQIVAVEEPELVGGLVLMNSICYDSWPIGIVKAVRAAGPLVARMPTSLFRPTYAAFIRMGHDDRDTAKESFRAHWPHYGHPAGPAAFIRQVRSLDVRDTLRISPRLPDVRRPARIVWGAADPFQTLDYGHRLARDLGAELDAVEGGRHFVPEDHPDRVATAVRTLVKER